MQTATAAETGKATLGRIVHFCLDNGEIVPAIVVNASTDKINLQLFRDRPEVENNLTYQKEVPFSATPKPNTWHWPQRM
jgi:hypothetical protein